MSRILITGATGNIGHEVVHYLSLFKSDSMIWAGVRDIEKAKQKLQNYGNLDFKKFDFEEGSTYSKAFEQIDILFLLRPPHISDVEKIFRPLLDAAREKGVDKVVFLSVQGAEKSKVIPHNKIERLIQELGFRYIFVRPSYFMQNLTTTLLPEIVRKQSITLPSGQAEFNWIDVRNIGEATAVLITQFETCQNQAYEITGLENINFEEVAALLSEIIEKPIEFKNVNPVKFYFQKKKEGINHGFALVMTLLHFLPRWQAEPKITDTFQKLTGNVPTTLREFITREKEKLAPPLS